MDLIGAIILGAWFVKWHVTSEVRLWGLATKLVTHQKFRLGNLPKEATPENEGHFYVNTHLK